MENLKTPLPEFLGKDVKVSRAGTATNPHSNEDFDLTAVEMTVYVTIIEAEKKALKIDHKFIETMDPEDLKDEAVPYWELVRNGQQWFKKNNPKAYQVLLD